MQAPAVPLSQPSELQKTLLAEDTTYFSCKIEKKQADIDV